MSGYFGQCFPFTCSKEFNQQSCHMHGGDDIHISGWAS